MKSVKYLFLVLSLLLFLWGCSEEPAPTTAPTVPAGTTQPATEPPASPEQLYANAIDTLRAAESWSFSAEGIKTIDIAGEGFEEEWNQTVTAGQDGVIKRSDSVNYCSGRAATPLPRTAARCSLFLHRWKHRPGPYPRQRSL